MDRLCDPNEQGGQNYARLRGGHDSGCHREQMRVDPGQGRIEEYRGDQQSGGDIVDEPVMDQAASMHRVAPRASRRRKGNLSQEKP
ncbi:hypothetical protein, partial [Sphingobium yanoikuyae]|uniref:hypothetical protein n=1 Tax=Sphingobium yanoikuyae TaxID=13690 RepID=UPI00211BF8E8